MIKFLILIYLFTATFIGLADDGPLSLKLKVLTNEIPLYGSATLEISLTNNTKKRIESIRSVYLPKPDALNKDGIFLLIKDDSIKEIVKPIKNLLANIPSSYFNIDSNSSKKFVIKLMMDWENNNLLFNKSGNIEIICKYLDNNKNLNLRAEVQIKVLEFKNASEKIVGKEFKNDSEIHTCFADWNTISNINDYRSFHQRLVNLHSLSEGTSYDWMLKEVVGKFIKKIERAKESTTIKGKRKILRTLDISSLQSGYKSPEVQKFQQAQKIVLKYYNSIENNKLLVCKTLLSKNLVSDLGSFDKVWKELFNNFKIRKEHGVNIKYTINFLDTIFTDNRVYINIVENTKYSNRPTLVEKNLLFIVNEKLSSENILEIRSGHLLKKDIKNKPLENNAFEELKRKTKQLLSVEEQNNFNDNTIDNNKLDTSNNNYYYILFGICIIMFVGLKIRNWNVTNKT
jgi:hypothetical protein